MAEVGIRELRDHLSSFLERVQSGEEVVVTDRGRAVARVVPVSGERTIDRLVREGKVTPAAVRGRRVPKRVKASNSVSELVAEQRR
jgi:prevent-host-death family protein